MNCQSKGKADPWRKSLEEVKGNDQSRLIERNNGFTCKVICPRRQDSELRLATTCIRACEAKKGTSNTMLLEEQTCSSKLMSSLLVTDFDPSNQDSVNLI